MSEPVPASLTLESTLAALRAGGEPTRLRLLMLLSRGELTVTELTQILGQSQPRVSRHLKLLAEAGLIERFREGSWVFYRLADAANAADGAAVAGLAGMLVQFLDPHDDTLARDLEKLGQVKRARAAAAAAYFRANAERWEKLRALHLPEADVEKAIVTMLGEERVDELVDLGTGTGRILELLGPKVERGIGIDLSHEMLTIARANLEKARLRHCHVRHGDILSLPFAAGSVSLVTLHLVLHYLSDPGAAVAEAARILRPGGRLLIVDFAPHDLEFLREEHAHRRLGFADSEVKAWCRANGLAVADSLKLEAPDHGSPDDPKLTVSIWLCVQTRRQSEPAYQEVAE